MEAVQEMKVQRYEVVYLFNYQGESHPIQINGLTRLITKEEALTPEMTEFIYVESVHGNSGPASVFGGIHLNHYQARKIFDQWLRAELKKQNLL